MVAYSNCSASLHGHKLRLQLQVVNWHEPLLLIGWPQSVPGDSSPLPKCWFPWWWPRLYLWHLALHIWSNSTFYLWNWIHHHRVLAVHCLLLCSSWLWGWHRNCRGQTQSPSRKGKAQQLGGRCTKSKDSSGCSKSKDSNASVCGWRAWRNWWVITAWLSQ